MRNLTDTKTEIVLNDSEIHTLNEAQTILDEYSIRCRDLAWKVESEVISIPNAAGYGAIHAMAKAASESIFQCLNWTNAYNVRKLSDEQLHNKP